MSGAFIVGLTGGIASGKSAFADRLAALGAVHVDTDQISRALTSVGGEAVPAIATVFGQGVVASDGSLERQRMREIVFNDRAARHQLELILHPMIASRTDQELRAAVPSYIVLSVPLLFESGRMLARCTRTLVVDVPGPIQLSRLLKRQGMTHGLATQILSTQLGRVARLARADDCVDNCGELTLLDAAAHTLHRRYLAMAKGSGRRE